MSLCNIKEITTISFYSSIWSEYGGLHVFAEDGAEDIHDFAQGGVGLDGFDDGGHGVFCAFGNATQILQCAFGGGVVALTTDAVEAFKVRTFALAVDVERGDFDFLFHDKVVYANDGAPVLVNLLLVAIGRLCNLTLEEAIMDAGQD